MALDGDEDHDDQARYKAMPFTAFRSDALRRVPKRGPNLILSLYHYTAASLIIHDYFSYTSHKTICNYPIQGSLILRHARIHPFTVKGAISQYSTIPYPCLHGSAHDV